MCSCRLPVQLAGLQSMLPLHSATAAALFTSQLSLHKDKWGCLSEGNAKMPSSPLGFFFFPLFLLQWLDSILFFIANCILPLAHFVTYFCCNGLTVVFLEQTIESFLVLDGYGRI